MGLSAWGDEKVLEMDKDYVNIQMGKIINFMYILLKLKNSLTTKKPEFTKPIN